MAAPITTVSPVSEAAIASRLSAAEEAPVLVDRATLAPANLEVAISQNLQAAQGPDLTSQFGVPDQLLSEAMNLLSQKDPKTGLVPQENALRAQLLISQADLIFKTISKVMEVQSDEAKAAIQAANSR
jgi:hypothetical protein